MRRASFAAPTLLIAGVKPFQLHHHGIRFRGRNEDGRQIPPYQSRGCAWPHGCGSSNPSNSTRLPHTLTTINNASEKMKVINRKRRPTNSGAHGDYPDPSPCEYTQSRLTGSVPERSAAKRTRTADCVKILLDVAKESSDWFPPLKSALGGVNALIKHYEVLVERPTVLQS